MKVNLIKHGKENQHDRHMEKIKQNVYMYIYLYKYDYYIWTTQNEEKYKIPSVTQFISIFLERNSIYRLLERKTFSMRPA